MDKRQAASLTLVLVALGLVGVFASDHPELSHICSSKGSTVRLSSINEVRKLIEQVRAMDEPTLEKKSAIEGRPCNIYRDSFTDLQPLVDLQLAGRVCDMAFVEALRSYHSTYLHSKGSKHENIPKPLRRFVLVLGFQASAVCKINIINSLEVDATRVLNDDDRAVIKKASEYSSYLFVDDNSKVRDFDDIVLLGDLTKIQAQVDDELEARENAKKGSEKVEKRRVRRPKKVLLNVKTTKLMETMIAKCQLRFKPLYSRLVLPLVQLINLGFDYRGELLARELEELKDSPVIKQWYSLVQVCEAVGMIELEEDHDAQFEDQRAFKVGGRIGHAHEKRQSYMERIVAASKEEPIEYENQLSAPNDELWIEGQKELNDLVNRYDFSLTETDRVYKKLVKRAFKSLFSKKFIHLMTDVMKKGLLGFKDEDLESSDMRATFLESLDDAADIVEANPKIAEQMIDSQVSGVAANAVIAARPRPIPMRHNGSSFYNQVHQFKVVGILSDRINLLCFVLGVIGIVFLLMSVLMTTG